VKATVTADPIISPAHLSTKYPRLLS